MKIIKSFDLKAGFFKIFTNILKRITIKEGGMILSTLKLVVFCKENSHQNVLKTLNNIKGVEIAYEMFFPSSLEYLNDEWIKNIKNFLVHRFDFAINLTPFLEINDLVVKNAPAASIINRDLVRLLQQLLTESEQLKVVENLRGELLAVLNSVQEAIEVADNDGTIKYVNAAFSNITGINREDRIGKNIFDVSPNGALAQCLLNRLPVTGYRTYVGGSPAEVISNAAPVTVDGHTQGAVVVFQPITDILKLMEELQKSNLIIENLYAKLDQITESKYTFSDLVGSSKFFNATVDLAKKAAKSEAPVLIIGESGTGKEIYAHAIHNAGSKRHKPFVKFGCTTIPESLLETELFGYEKGAFAGAIKTKIGKIELANNGTLFLHEISEMNLFLQAKLVRVMKDMQFERVGGTRPQKINLRIIASSNRDIKQLIRKGLFREDLYYLLSILEINIPSLRQRKEDVLALATHFIKRLNRKLGKYIKGIAPEANQLLLNYDWPGNARELENILERIMVLTDDDYITYRQLAPYLGQEDLESNFFSEVMPIDKAEQILLKAALARYGDSLEGKKKAAQALNISLATLYNKLKKYKANF